MIWQQWVLVLMFVLSMLENVRMIGKPREPLAPTVVSIALVIQLLAIAMIVHMPVR